MRSSFLLTKFQLLMLIAKDRGVSRCAVTTAGVIINAYNNKTGRCFPSFSYIASQTNYSVRQVKKSIGEIVPKYIIKTSKGHTGRANTYNPRFELLNQIKSNSLDELKVGNYEVTSSELEVYAKVSSGALQTVNETIKKTKSNMKRLRMLAPLVRKGINFSTVSQVDIEIMKREGLLKK